ncbi:MAG: PepSY-like domain-containing protein [Paramuribaculum sp.]|nr:PepSY-like domain-containing protein [Paramuribaculum sp.]
MKKLYRILPMLLVAVLSIALWSCSDDDEPVPVTKLPSSSQTFLNTYFDNVDIISVTKDKDDYEVLLSNGYSVEFNTSGEWTDVDAPVGKTVPTGFYPAAIDTYISSAYSGSGINEISRIDRGYEVELLNGTDLYFSADGTYIGIDRD